MLDITCALAPMNYPVAHDAFQASLSLSECSSALRNASLAVASQPCCGMMRLRIHEAKPPFQRH